MDLHPQAKIVSTILKQLSEMAEVGTRLTDLNVYCEELIATHGATAYNKGYLPVWASKPFPAALCTSLNDVIAHGIPTDYKLKEGDILNLDLGIKKDGYCGDASMTIGIGEIENKHERLMRYAKRALYVGIAEVTAGAQVTAIGDAIERYARQMGYVVNKAFSGHGIGEEMHQDPTIFHFDVGTQTKEKMQDIKLIAGQVICIEPMLTWKDTQGYLDRDGWTYRTRDGKTSVMFESMVLVKEGGYEVLTDHFDLNTI